MTNKINHIASNIPGDVYRRAHTVTLNNPKDRNKSLSFAIEDIINLLDGSYKAVDAGFMDFEFSKEELKTKINLIDPETGEKLGEDYIGQMLKRTFVALNSLMIHIEEKMYVPVSTQEIEEDNSNE